MEQLNGVLSLVLICKDLCAYLFIIIRIDDNDNINDDNNDDCSLVITLGVLGQQLCLPNKVMGQNPTMFST